MKQLITAVVLATAVTAQAEEPGGLWGWVKDHSCGGQWSCSDTKVAENASENLYTTNTIVSKVMEANAILKANGEDYHGMVAECSAKFDPLEKKSITPQEQVKIEKLVRDQLKDPDSAKFREVRAANSYDQCKAITPYKDATSKLDSSTYKWSVEIRTRTMRDSIPLYYTEVNGKNSYGGYIGFQNVIVRQNGEVEFPKF